MGLAETLQIDEMVQDFKRMNKRQVSCWAKKHKPKRKSLANKHTRTQKTHHVKWNLFKKGLRGTVMNIFTYKHKCIRVFCWT